MKRDFTDDDVSEVLPVLADIGTEEYRRTRGSIPDKISDVLAKQLTPTIRTKLAKRLIEIALDGSGTVSLNAIKEIWDRVEGRSRQSIVTSRAHDDPLLELLESVFREESRLVPVAEFRILDSGQDLNGEDPEP